MRTRLLLVILFIAATELIAQKNGIPDKIIRNMDTLRVAKADFGLFRITPYFAPSYSPEISLMFSGGGLLTFKSQKTNTALNLSTIPFSAGYSINGSFYFQVNHIIYWPNDKVRTVGEFHMRKMPENFWGIGHADGLKYMKGDSTYYYKEYWRFYQKVMFKTWADVFLGGMIDLNRTQATRMNDQMTANDNVRSFGPDVFNAGLGIVVEYDSRDFPQNAYKGMYFGSSILSYGKWMGADYSYYLAELDFRRYFTIKRERSTLAIQVKGSFAFGPDDVPWTNIPMLGGNIGLRGYTLGRFRDRNLVQAIVEYRRMFQRKTVNKRGNYDSRFGYVVWLGTGSVGHYVSDLTKWLPNGGVGLRFEVNQRMNLRFDYGLGKGEKGGYITFSESF